MLCCAVLCWSGAQVVKKKVKKVAVPFTSDTSAKSKEEIQKLYEEECAMALQVGGARSLALAPQALSGGWLVVEGGLML